MSPILGMTINKDVSSEVGFSGRRAARVLAVQYVYCLYALGNSADSKDEDEFFRLFKRIDNTDRDYFLFLVRGLAKNQEMIDRHITSHLATGWNLNRLSVVVLSILRLAVYELLFHMQIDPPVLINEYLEIIKLFNHEAEVGFINGVMDNVLKNLDSFV